jgi:two-component sensor histidine kinase
MEAAMALDAAGTPFDPIAEANHRIANHLAMVCGMFRLHSQELKRRTQPITNDEAAAILGAMEAKVVAVANLHRLLARPQNEDTVDLADYLGNVAAGVVAALTSGEPPRLDLALMPDCLATPRQAFAIALIVSELLTNSLKYAHPTGVTGHMSVTCTRSGGRLAIRVSDDGIGFPDGFDPESDGALGFRVIRGLAQQLDGDIRFQSDPLGTIVDLTVPMCLESGPRMGTAIFREPTAVAEKA